MDYFPICSECGEIFDTQKEKVEHGPNCTTQSPKRPKMDTASTSISSSTATPGSSLTASEEALSELSFYKKLSPLKGASSFQTPDNKIAFGVTPGAPKKLKPVSKGRRQRPDTLAVLTEGSNPPGQILADRPDAEQELIRQNWVSIKNYSHAGKTQSVYNIRLLGAGSSSDEITSKLKSIFESQKSSFKINCSVGSVLRNKDSGRLRYYHASANNHRMFEPQQIQNLEDLKTFIAKLGNVDFSQNLKVSAESSEWLIHCVSNLSVYVNHLS